MKNIISAFLILLSTQVSALTYYETWEDDFTQYNFVDILTSEEDIKNTISDKFFTTLKDLHEINFVIDADENQNFFEITDIIYWSDPNYVDDGKLYNESGNFKCENYEAEITIKLLNVLFVFLERDLTPADKLNNIKNKGIFQIYSKLAYLDYDNGNVFRNHDYKKEMECEIKVKMEKFINIPDLNLNFSLIWQNISFNAEDYLNSRTYNNAGNSAIISFETFIGDDWIYFDPIPIENFK